MSHPENEEFYCPCREVDPDHFISNNEIKWLIENQNKYTFKQEDFLRLYNCIHCNDCGTSESRFLLKKKFLQDGGKIKGLKKTIDALITLGTPFIHNKSRVKVSEDLYNESDTLLYLGCFTTVKTPRYAENLIKYLLNKGIIFTLLREEFCCGYPILCNGAIEVYSELVLRNKALFKEKGFKTIITACPSCYMVFKKEYSDMNIEVKYFTDYLTVSNQKKAGNLIIQHACPLRNGEIPGIVEKLENIFRESGYTVLDEVPIKCCGGGVGHQLRTDIIDEIATNRMMDFKKESGFFNNLDSEQNYITTYCPDAYWILKVYGKKMHIPFLLKDLCELLF